MPADTYVTTPGLELVTLEAQPSDVAEMVVLDGAPMPAGADAATPPAEVRLLPAGTFRTTKGSFTFDAAAAKSVMDKAADWGNEYCFDMGHSMVAPDVGADPATAARAYGWYSLKVNDAGELVTSGLKWTERGATMLTKREVRYISPAIRTDPKTGRVVEFINAALTNLPATKGMRPIVASRTAETTPGAPPMKVVLSALGLSDAANESEALDAVTRLKDFAKEITALTGKSADESVGEVSAWKARSAEVATLTAQLVKMKAKKDEKKVQALVAKALEDKVIPPSLEEKMLETGRKDRKLLKAVLKSLKPLASHREVGTEKGAGGDKTKLSDLSKAEQEVVKMLGLKPEAFAATREKGVHESEFKPKDDESKDDESKADAETATK